MISFLTKIIQMFKKTKPTKPFIDVELASDDVAIYKRHRFIPYFDDEVLDRKRIKLYRQMMTDAEIFSCINTIKTIRLSSGWEVLPASDDARDAKIRDFVQYNLENLENWDLQKNLKYKLIFWPL